MRLWFERVRQVCCHGRDLPLCVLDAVLVCRSKRVCDAHDRRLQRGTEPFPVPTSFPEVKVVSPPPPLPESMQQGARRYPTP